VSKRFNTWLEKQGTASPKAAPAAVAAKKRGRPAKVAAAPPAKAAPAPAPVAAKKRGRPAKQNVVVAAPKRANKLAASAAKAKRANAKRPVAELQPSFDMTVPLLGGDTVKREIAMLEARLEYLRLIQKAEADFLRKIGR
jgi:hypothetical protein